MLIIDVETEAVPEGLVGLEDRVGALNGRLVVRPAQRGRVRIRADIPCE
jgi:signal transduction histidine kinase